MYEADDFIAAKDALVAAAHRDRPATMALLAKYGAQKLPDLRVRDLVPFTNECRKIEAPIPKVELQPAFAVGERVRHVHSSADSTVAGYELRYVLQDADGNVRYNANGVRSDRLERSVPPACPPPVADFDYHEMFAIGNSVDDVKGYKDCGRAFALDGGRLIEALRLRGLRVVRK